MTSERVAALARTMILELGPWLALLAFLSWAILGFVSQ